jgi:hypothetical protein
VVTTGCCFNGPLPKTLTLSIFGANDSCVPVGDYSMTYVEPGNPGGGTWRVAVPWPGGVVYFTAVLGPPLPTPNPPCFFYVNFSASQEFINPYDGDSDFPAYCCPFLWNLGGVNPVAPTTKGCSAMDLPCWGPAFVACNGGFNFTVSGSLTDCLEGIIVSGSCSSPAAYCGGLPDTLYVTPSIVCASPAQTSACAGDLSVPIVWNAAAGNYQGAGTLGTCNPSSTPNTNAIGVEYSLCLTLDPTGHLLLILNAGFSHYLPGNDNLGVCDGPVTACAFAPGGNDSGTPCYQTSRLGPGSLTCGPPFSAFLPSGFGAGSADTNCGDFEFGCTDFNAALTGFYITE